MEYDGLITKPTLEELYHHGIKGQKWGKKNGPPYPLDSKISTGKRLKSSGRKVFVSGSSKTQDKTSGYYRRKLPKNVRNELDQKMKNGDTIIVGDAPGIDRQVQDYLKKKRYKNVEVYSPGTESRYLADKKWKNNLIDAPEFEPGSPEWLAKKDKIMQKVADEGIAVILDKGSSATKNNINQLLTDNKDVSIYELSGAGKKRDYKLNSEDVSYIKQLNSDIKEAKTKVPEDVQKYIDNSVGYDLETKRNEYARYLRDPEKWKQLPDRHKDKNQVPFLSDSEKSIELNKISKLTDRDKFIKFIETDPIYKKYWSAQNQKVTNIPGEDELNELMLMEYELWLRNRI